MIRWNKELYHMDRKAYDKWYYQNFRKYGKQIGKRLEKKIEKDVSDSIVKKAMDYYGIYQKINRKYPRELKIVAEEFGSMTPKSTSKDVRNAVNRTIKRYLKMKYSDITTAEKKRRNTKKFSRSYWG